jgi:hypothetical protein
MLICRKETFFLSFDVVSNQKFVAKISCFRQCLIKNFTTEFFLYSDFKRFFGDLMLERVTIACSYAKRNQRQIFGGVQVGVVVPH